MRQKPFFGALGAIAVILILHAAFLSTSSQFPEFLPSSPYCAQHCAVQPCQDDLVCAGFTWSLVALLTGSVILVFLVIFSVVLHLRVQQVVHIQQVCRTALQNFQDPFPGVRSRVLYAVQDHVRAISPSFTPYIVSLGVAACIFAAGVLVPTLVNPLWTPDTTPYVCTHCTTHNCTLTYTPSHSEAPFITSILLVVSEALVFAYLCTLVCRRRSPPVRTPAGLQYTPRPGTLLQYVCDHPDALYDVVSGTCFQGCGTLNAPPAGCGTDAGEVRSILLSNYISHRIKGGILGGVDEYIELLRKVDNLDYGCLGCSVGVSVEYSPVLFGYNRATSQVFVPGTVATPVTADLVYFEHDNVSYTAHKHGGWIAHRLDGIASWVPSITALVGTVVGTALVPYTHSTESRRGTVLYAVEDALMNGTPGAEGLLVAAFKGTCFEGCTGLVLPPQSNTAMSATVYGQIVAAMHGYSRLNNVKPVKIPRCGNLDYGCPQCCSIRQGPVSGGAATRIALVREVYDFWFTRYTVSRVSGGGGEEPETAIQFTSGDVTYTRNVRGGGGWIQSGATANVWLVDLPASIRTYSNVVYGRTYLDCPRPAVTSILPHPDPRWDMVIDNMHIRGIEEVAEGDPTEPLSAKYVRPRLYAVVVYVPVDEGLHDLIIRIQGVFKTYGERTGMLPLHLNTVVPLMYNVGTFPVQWQVQEGHVTPCVEDVTVPGGSQLYTEIWVVQLQWR